MILHYTTKIYRYLFLRLASQLSYPTNHNQNCITDIYKRTAELIGTEADGKNVLLMKCYSQWKARKASVILALLTCMAYSQITTKQTQFLWKKTQRAPGFNMGTKSSLNVNQTKIHNIFSVTIFLLNLLVWSKIAPNKQYNISPIGADSKWKQSELLGRGDRFDKWTFTEQVLLMIVNSVTQEKWNGEENPVHQKKYLLEEANLKQSERS